MSNQVYLRNTKSSPYARKVFKRIRRMHRKDLCVHWEDAKRLLAHSPTTNRYKSVNISVNNNMNLKFFYIHTYYTIWDGLSQKTISRYCPFNHLLQLWCATGDDEKWCIFPYLAKTWFFLLKHCHFLNDNSVWTGFPARQIWPLVLEQRIRH